MTLVSAGDDLVIRPRLYEADPGSMRVALDRVLGPIGVRRVAQTVGMGVWAMGAAMYPAFISELFPTHTRAAGVAFATSVSVALFGGTAPYLMTWFDQSGIGWGFWVWVGVLSSLAILGGTLVRETKGIDLGAVTSPFRERGPARTEQEGATR